MPPRGSVGTGARHPPLPSYVEGEGARARWEGTGGRLTAHAGPAHPPESPHVRSGPTSRGRESEEEAERAGLALPLAAEVCSRLLVPSELEARAAGAGARAQWAGGGGCSDLGPGRAESVEGAGRRRGSGRAAVSATRSLRSSPRVGEKFSGGLLWGPPSLPATCAAPPPPVPARVPLGARPPSPARPGARGAEPITSARAWPASCSRSRGCPSREPRAASGAPPPRRPARGR